MWHLIQGYIYEDKKKGHQNSVYMPKLMGVSTLQDNLPQSSHYARTISGNFRSLVFGEPNQQSVTKESASFSKNAGSRPKKHFLQKHGLTI